MNNAGKYHFVTRLEGMWKATPQRSLQLGSRASLVTRTRVLLALSATLAVLVSLIGLLLAMRMWMIWQTDDALHSDLTRLIETYDDTMSLSQQFIPQPIPEVLQQEHEKKIDQHLSHKRHEHEKVEESQGILLSVARQDSNTPNIGETVIIQRFTAYLLTQEDLAVLSASPVAKTPQSIHLPESGNYRILSRSVDGITYTVGRGTGDISQMMLWSALSALGILLITATLVAYISGKRVRRELQPLQNVVSVSRMVSHNLEENRYPGVERVPMHDIRQGSEIDDVANALNALLDNVDQSLHVKEQANEQLRQFIADASHELRTPLASIRGYTQLLEQGAINTPSALERISAESARMHDLIEGLLLLARLDSGRKVASEPVDLLPIAIESIADANASAPDHHWKLTLPDELSDGCLVNGDEAALRQVFANLLANARNHTPRGTTVHLYIHHSQQEVAIHVQDNGPGIPIDIRHNIFDRFVRAESSRSRDNGGSSGLGLSIVQALVEEMGGTVRLAQSSDATSAELSGAHFVVHFPKEQS